MHANFDSRHNLLVTRIAISVATDTLAGETNILGIRLWF